MSLGELNPCGGGDPIPLIKPWLVIGRQPSCDISLRFPNVSSRHCEIRLLNGYWYVRDLGSRNGIKVNGIRCDSHWLMPGDVISVSKHRYEMQYTPYGDAPPPEADPMSISLLEKAGLARSGDTLPVNRPESRIREPIESAPVDDSVFDDDRPFWLDK